MVRGAVPPADVGRRSETGARPSAPRPRKRFGQHFLVDGGTIARIVDLVHPEPGEVVLEIGPGRGALTTPLLGQLSRLVAVEIDRDLAAALRRRWPAEALRLVEGDILAVDLAAVLAEEGGQRLLVVGNLPYNITAPLLFHLLAHADHVSRAVLMVQREVAARLTATPGSREYGLITVLLRMRAQVEVRLPVPRARFRPVPGVDSAVIELRFTPTNQVAVGDRAAWQRLVRAAFGQRRKMLRNTLLAAAPSLLREDLRVIAERSGIDLERRPETLDLAEFARLSDVLVALAAERP